MVARSFLDTNILIYSVDRADPTKQNTALELIARHAKDRTGVISTQVLQEVIALVELGRPPAEVAEEMEISRDLVYAWKSQASQRAQLGSGGAGAVGDQAATDELRALRRRVADLQLENDILKKPR